MSCKIYEAGGTTVWPTQTFYSALIWVVRPPFDKCLKTWSWETMILFVRWKRKFAIAEIKRAQFKLSQNLWFLCSFHFSENIHRCPFKSFWKDTLLSILIWEQLRFSGRPAVIGRCCHCPTIFARLNFLCNFLTFYICTFFMFYGFWSTRILLYFPPSGRPSDRSSQAWHLNLSR